MKDFVTSAILKSIDEFETHLDNLSLKEISQEDLDTAVSLDEAEKIMGWNKL